LSTFPIELLPTIKKAMETPFTSNGKTIGWHVCITTQAGYMGGGVNADRNNARKIAIAEILERKSVNDINHSPLRSEFKLDFSPSTCGFAAGFESRTTRLRSVSEAIERWAWSKWIDDGYFISEVSVSPNSLSDIAKLLLSEFDQVKFYLIHLNQSEILDFPKQFFFGAAIGFKNGGAFPGSRISGMASDIWEHALVEAWRHQIIFNDKKNKQDLEAPYDRIIEFGNDGAQATAQIDSADLSTWPKPVLLMEKRLNDFLKDPNRFEIWRCLAKDYIGWELGAKNRFVY